MQGENSNKVHECQLDMEERITNVVVHLGHPKNNGLLRIVGFEFTSSTHKTCSGYAKSDETKEASGHQLLYMTARFGVPSMWSVRLHFDSHCKTILR